MSQIKNNLTAMNPEKNNPKVTNFDVPSIASSLKEVYQIGSIPLVLLFIAAVAIFYLLQKGIITALPSLIYLIVFLIASGVCVFLVINYIAYKKWKEELNARLENRRLEMDLFNKLTSNARETQDKFLINILEYLWKLSDQKDSTPEGRKKEIEYVTDSVGSMIERFVSIRNKVELPQFTDAIPENNLTENHDSEEKPAEVKEPEKKGG